jgi:hypothetical protein
MAGVKRNALFTVVLKTPFVHDPSAQFQRQASVVV